MKAIFAITATSLRLFLRDRSNWFFVFVLPVILVVLIGLQFGEGEGGGSVIVTGSSGFAERVAQALEDGDLQVRRGGDPGDARDVVARGRADAAVFVTADDARAHEAGESVDLEVVTGGGAGGMASQQAVSAAVTGLAGERAGVAALTAAGVDETRAREALAAASGEGPGVVVSTIGQDELAEEFAGLGRFDLGAAQQLSLFVFLTSLAGSAVLIQARRLGVTRRELAGPVTTAHVIAGEALGRFAVALTQGLYIVVGTGLFFGVDWGSPTATGAVLVAFCAVSAAAAMVFGALLDNENTAGGVGVGVGLVSAALGGSMLPLELFPDGLLVVSSLMPHHWAYEAYAAIQRNGAGLGDVLVEVGVLVGMAAALLALGTVLLRRATQRAI